MGDTQLIDYHPNKQKISPEDFVNKVGSLIGIKLKDIAEYCPSKQYELKEYRTNVSTTCFTIKLKIWDFEIYRGYFHETLTSIMENGRRETSRDGWEAAVVFYKGRPVGVIRGGYEIKRMGIAYEYGASSLKTSGLSNKLRRVLFGREWWLKRLYNELKRSTSGLFSNIEFLDFGPAGI